MGAFVAVAAVVVALSVALVGALIWENVSVRSRMLEQARVSVESGARLLGDSAGQAIRGADAALAELAGSIEKTGALGDADAINRLLLSRLPRFPPVRSLTVHDRDGRLLAGGENGVGPSDVSGRPFFGQHRDGAAISAVTIPDDHAENGLRISRRLQSTDGAFAGTVSALLDPSAFEALFGAEVIKRVDAGAILVADGRILASWPRPGGVAGEPGDGDGLSSLRELTPAVLAKRGGPQDLPSTIVAVAPVQGAPMVAAAAMSRDRILAHWRGGAWRTLAVVAGIIASVGIIGVFLSYTQARRRARWSEAIRVRDRIVQASTDGVVVVDMLGAEPAIAFVNPAFERITGYPAAEVVGRNPRFLYREDVDQDGVAEFRRALREGTSVHAGFRALRKDGTPFRLEIDLAPVEVERSDPSQLVAVVHDGSAGEVLEVADRSRELLTAALRFATASLLGGREAAEGLDDLLRRLGRIAGAEGVALLDRSGPGEDLRPRGAWIAPLPSTAQDALPAGELAADFARDPRIAAAAGGTEAVFIESSDGGPQDRILERWGLSRAAIIPVGDGGQGRGVLAVAGSEACALAEPDGGAWRAVAGLLGAVLARGSVRGMVLDGTFARAVEAGRVGIWEWDRRDGRFVVSANVKAMLGYEPEEIADRMEAWSRHFHPDDHRVFAEAVDDHFMRKAPVIACEHRMITKSGDVLWFRARGVAERDGSGEPVRVVGTILDITEGRVAEQALAEKEARLAEAQRIAALGYWERDLVTGALKLSPQVYGIFGIPAGTEVSEATFIAAVHPPERERLRVVMTAAAVKAGAEREGSFRITRTDGSVRHVQVRVHAQRDGEGRAIRLIGTLRDVTEQRELSDALVRARAQAERANIARSSFLAQMSHELRTPLNSVIGFSDMMLGEILGPLGDAKYKEYAQDINAAGQHLLELINDILDVSRIEAVATDSAESAVSLKAVVERCREALRDRFVEAGLRFVGDVPGTLPSIRAEAPRIEQIVRNLLTQSLATTPLGGTVGIRAEEDEDDGVLLTVFDSGTGEVAQEGGDPLSSGSRRATMGITVTRALVDLLGGTMSIRRTPEDGRAVVVRFGPDRVIVPAAEEEPKERAATS